MDRDFLLYGTKIVAVSVALVILIEFTVYYTVNYPYPYHYVSEVIEENRLISLQSDIVLRNTSSLDISMSDIKAIELQISALGINTSLMTYSDFYEIITSKYNINNTEDYLAGGIYFHKRIIEIGTAYMYNPVIKLKEKDLRNSSAYMKNITKARIYLSALNSILIDIIERFYNLTVVKEEYKPVFDNFTHSYYKKVYDTRSASYGREI